MGNSVSNQPGLGQSDPATTSTETVAVAQPATVGAVSVNHEDKAAVLQHQPHDEDMSQSSSSDSSSDSSSSDSSDSDSSDSDVDINVNAVVEVDDVKPPRTKNETIVVEEFAEAVPEGIKESHTLQRVGEVLHPPTDADPNQLVVISDPNVNAVDERSVMCLEGRHLLGRVTEVFGPVSRPFFVIRFAAGSMPPMALLQQGAAVFTVTELSSTILKEKLQTKGYDASNVHDEELPPSAQEFSDDEKEAQARKQRRRKKADTRDAHRATKRARPTVAARAYTPQPRAGFGSSMSPALQQKYAYGYGGGGYQAPQTAAAAPTQHNWGVAPPAVPSHMGYSEYLPAGAPPVPQPTPPTHPRMP